MPFGPAATKVEVTQTTKNAMKQHVDPSIIREICRGFHNKNSTDGFTYDRVPGAGMKFWESAAKLWESFRSNSFRSVSLGHRATLKISKFNPKLQQNRWNSTFFTLKISKPWVIIKLYLWFHPFYEFDRGWITKKLPIWNFWNKCCGSVVALIYRKPGSGSPRSHSVFSPWDGWYQKLSICIFHSWGHIGSSQSNSCKLSFLNFQAVLDSVKIKLQTSFCFHLCQLCCVFLFQALTLQEFVRGCRRILDLWCHACVMRCTADRILGFDGDAHHIFKGRNLKGPNFVILCFVAMVRMQVWFFVQIFLWMLYDDLDLTRSWNVVQCGNVKASDEVMNLSKFFMYTIWCLYLSLLMEGCIWCWCRVFFHVLPQKATGGLSHASAMLSDGHEHSLTYKLMIILRKFDQDSIRCWIHVHDEFFGFGMTNWHARKSLHHVQFNSVYSKFLILNRLTV